MSLEQFREKIDEIDDKIIELFIQRMEVCEELALFKKDNKLPIMNPNRESDIKNRLKKNIKKSKIDSDFVDELYNSVFNESKRIQRELF